MIPRLRKRFNAAFQPEVYRTFLRRLETLSGTHIGFRVSETPCFFPGALIDTMAAFGVELVMQLVDNPAYRTASDFSIPPEFDVPGDPGRPLFVAVDFGLIRDERGSIRPKLVEIQGFPSLYAYQPFLAQQYVEAFGLDPTLRFIPGGLDIHSYNDLLRKAILGSHEPENVVLMEIDPFEQKTLVDFLLTQRTCGIPIVNITDIVKDDKKLFYRHEGRSVPIHRIYNRAIVDELTRKGKSLPFDFRDELDVEWAGHPNWFFRISKFSIPFLKHECVPQTRFLHETPDLPENLQDYVLKPLFSFAGLGVVIGPTREQIHSIQQEKRSQFILQERVEFAPLIETPHGPTKAEVRVMYIWQDRLTPVMLIIRMGRGKMMGVDHNKNMEWVGSSAGLFTDEIFAE